MRARGGKHKTQRTKSGLAQDIMKKKVSKGQTNPRGMVVEEKAAYSPCHPDRSIHPARQISYRKEE